MAHALPRIMVLNDQSKEVIDSRISESYQSKLSNPPDINASFYEQSGSIDLIQYSNKLGIMIHCLPNDIAIKTRNTLNEEFFEKKTQISSQGLGYAGTKGFEKPTIIKLSVDEELLAVLSNNKSLSILKTRQLTNKKCDHSFHLPTQVDRIAWAQGGVLAWKFEAEAYYIDLGSKGIRQIVQLTSTRSIQYLNNTIVAAQAAQILLISVDSLQTIKKFDYSTQPIKQDKVGCFELVDYLFNVAIIKVNNLDTDTFKDDDIYAWVSVYYNSDPDDDENAPQKVLHFIQGNLLEGKFVVNYGDVLSTRFREYKEYHSGDKRRGFSVKHIILRKARALIFAVQRAETAYVVDLSAPFDKLCNFQLPTKQQFNATGQITGIALMRNKLKFECEYSGDHQDTANIVKKHNGNLFQVGFKEKDLLLAIPFPVSLIVWDHLGNQYKSYFIDLTNETALDECDMQKKDKEMARLLQFLDIHEPTHQFNGIKQAGILNVDIKPSIAQTKTQEILPHFGGGQIGNAMSLKQVVTSKKQPVTSGEKEKQSEGKQIQKSGVQNPLLQPEVKQLKTEQIQTVQEKTQPLIQKEVELKVEQIQKGALQNPEVKLKVEQIQKTQQIQKSTIQNPFKLESTGVIQNPFKLPQQSTKVPQTGKKQQLNAQFSSLLSKSPLTNSGGVFNLSSNTLFKPEPKKQQNTFASFKKESEQKKDSVQFNDLFKRSAVIQPSIFGKESQIKKEEPKKQQPSTLFGSFLKPQTKNDAKLEISGKSQMNGGSAGILKLEPRIEPKEEIKKETKLNTQIESALGKLQKYLQNKHYTLYEDAGHQTFTVANSHRIISELRQEQKSYLSLPQIILELKQEQESLNLRLDYLRNTDVPRNDTKFFQEIKRLENKYTNIHLIVTDIINNKLGRYQVAGLKPLDKRIQKNLNSQVDKEIAKYKEILESLQDRVEEIKDKRQHKQRQLAVKRKVLKKQNQNIKSYTFDFTESSQSDYEEVIEGEGNSLKIAQLLTKFKHPVCGLKNKQALLKLKELTVAQKEAKKKRENQLQQKEELKRIKESSTKSTKVEIIKQQEDEEQQLQLPPILAPQISQANKKDTKLFSNPMGTMTTIPADNQGIESKKPVISNKPQSKQKQTSSLFSNKADVKLLSTNTLFGKTEGTSLFGKLGQVGGGLFGKNDVANKPKQEIKQVNNKEISNKPTEIQKADVLKNAEKQNIPEKNPQILPPKAPQISNKLQGQSEVKQTQKLGIHSNPIQTIVPENKAEQPNQKPEQPTQKIEQPNLFNNKPNLTTGPTSGIINLPFAANNSSQGGVNIFNQQRTAPKFGQSTFGNPTQVSQTVNQPPKQNTLLNQFKGIGFNNALGNDGKNQQNLSFLSNTSNTTNNNTPVFGNNTFNSNGNQQVSMFNNSTIPQNNQQGFLNQPNNLFASSSPGWNQSSIIPQNTQGINQASNLFKPRK